MGRDKVKYCPPTVNTGRQDNEGVVVRNSGQHAQYLVGCRHVVYGEHTGLRIPYIEILEHFWSVDITCTHKEDIQRSFRGILEVF